MKQKLFSVFILILLILGMVSCSSGVRPGNVKIKRQTLTGIVYKIVKSQNYPMYDESVGTVIAATSSMVSSKIMGVILHIHVHEGDFVKKGKLLITIDDTDIRAKVEQARQVMKQAQEAMSEVEDGIRASQQGVSAAKAQKLLADATYKRFLNLKLKQAVSNQEFDEVQAKWKAANAGLKQAEAMLSSMYAKKKQVEAKIKQAKAAVREASSYLKYTKIRSPYNCRVIRKLLNEGSMAAPGIPILTIEKTDHFQLLATFDASRMPFLKKGNTVNITIGSIGFESTCPIEDIIPSIDPATRTVQIKVGLSKNPLIHSGLFGKVRLQIGHQKSIRIPKTALYIKGDIEGVYVIGPDDIVHWRPVKTGKTYGNDIEIISGLNDGERVVTNNVEDIVDGARVEV